MLYGEYILNIITWCFEAMCKYTPPSGEPVRQGWPQKDLQIARILHTALPRQPHAEDKHLRGLKQLELYTKAT